MDPKRDSNLEAALQTVIGSKHPYVNATLKRLAKACNMRIAAIDAPKRK